MAARDDNTNEMRIYRYTQSTPHAICIKLNHDELCINVIETLFIAIAAHFFCVALSSQLCNSWMSKSSLWIVNTNPFIAVIHKKKNKC